MHEKLYSEGPSLLPNLPFSKSLLPLRLTSSHRSHQRVPLRVIGRRPETGTEGLGEEGSQSRRSRSESERGQGRRDRLHQAGGAEQTQVRDGGKRARGTWTGSEEDGEGMGEEVSVALFFLSSHVFESHPDGRGLLAT